MYVFGYLMMIKKWVLQQPSQEIDSLNWFNYTLSWVWLVKIVCYYRQFAKKKKSDAVNKRNWIFYNQQIFSTI